MFWIFLSICVIGYYLLEAAKLKSKHTTHGKKGAPLLITEEGLAKHLGMSKEDVASLVKQLKDIKVIEVNGNSYYRWHDVVEAIEDLD